MFLIKGDYARLVTRDVDSLRVFKAPLLRAEKRLLSATIGLCLSQIDACTSPTCAF